jgi:SAM-dependent methyltransferase
MPVSPSHEKASRTGLLAEMQAVPPMDESELLEPAFDVSFLIPARGAAHSLAETVRVAHEYLSRTFPSSFEIILIPNPAVHHPRAGATPKNSKDRSIEVSEELASRYDHVRVSPHRLPQGKGAALRTGFRASRGRWIFFTDADLPYELEFFTEAASQLRAGFDFVTGNRRLDTSHFDIPVSLLHLAYKRHRLGLAFNQVVRWLLPIQTTDTQAGIKAMSRRLAAQAFTRQTCPGFFFDLEIFLTSSGQSFRHRELPVALHLNTEKSTVRVLRESVLAGFWLTRITLRNLFKKAYGKGRPMQTSPTGRYRNVPFSTRFFLEARWRLTPYTVMASKLPPQGKILDLGCGHGLFALALAQGQPGRQVIGLDHDAARIRLARTAGEGVSNLQFTAGTLSDPEHTGAQASGGSVAGISMIDVMHYFTPSEQERLFAQAYELLAPGGTLIVREVNPGQGASSAFNRFYEKVATTTGFTRSEQKQSLHFRTREGWEDALRATGYEVSSEPCSHFLFADILYIAHKPTRDRGP